MNIHSSRMPNTQGVAGTIYGLVAAIIALLLLSFIGSSVVYFSSMSENSLYVMAVIINIIAMFAGGFMAGRKAKSRGLVRGLIVGVALLLLMLAFGSVTFSQLALKAGYCLPAAALGGVCGISG